MRSFSPQKVPPPPDLRHLPLLPSLPVDVEIGCGVGFHPLHYARAHPRRQLVAIERTSEKFEKFLGRLRNHEPLPNLFPIQGDAIAWISHAFTKESVDQYFLLYPNPYPKKSQANLRFHNMPFFSWLMDTLKVGGQITLATNKDFYADEAKEKIVSHWGMELVEDRIISEKEIPRTHFEKKYLSRGERCRNLVFRKGGKSK